MLMLLSNTNSLRVSVINVR